MNKEKQMRVTSLLKINALFLLAAGIAFGLYGPLMMAFFAIPQVINLSADAYWQIAAFARMYGAALFGFGLLVWAVQQSFLEIPVPSQKKLLAALILGHLMGAFISITEQSSIWWTPAGWITTAIYLLFMLAYIYSIIKLPPNRDIENQEPID